MPISMMTSSHTQKHMRCPISVDCSEDGAGHTIYHSAVHSRDFIVAEDIDRLIAFVVQYH